MHVLVELSKVVERRRMRFAVEAVVGEYTMLSDYLGQGLRHCTRALEAPRALHDAESSCIRQLFLDKLGHHLELDGVLLFDNISA